MPTDLDLNNQIFFNHTNAQAKGILYLLETGLRHPGKDSLSVNPLSSYELEHIMPKDWQAYWPLETNTRDNRENRMYHIGLLGNKTLLAKGLNKSLKNKGFDKKKMGDSNTNGGYNYYAMGLKTFDISLYDEWNESVIEERLRTILEQIKYVWPYEKAK